MNAVNEELYYPRVLLVNAEPISRKYAAGITMGNLFRGWPKDRIAQIYYDDSEPDLDICERSWHLELYDLRMPVWLREKLITQLAQRKLLTDFQCGNTAAESTGNKRSLRDHTVQILIKGLFKGFNFSSYRVTPQMNEWVDDFKPEVIYSTLGNLHMLKLVQNLSVHLSIPVVPHFMDDWIESLHSETLLEKFLKFRLLELTSQIMLDAPVMLVISEAMAEEYQKRYGRKFLPFMNCIDCDVYENAGRKSETGEVFRFVYAGGLHLGRLEMLLEVARALEAFKATLDIYTPNTPAGFAAETASFPAIRFRGAISPVNTGAVFANCDGLLHVESFEKAQKVYTRFSISTKLPEYFASGTAVFAYGPADITSIKYISTNNCGLVASDRNQTSLASRLKEFISNESMRREAADNAIKLCVQKHGAVMQREKFREVFTRYGRQ